MGGSVGASTNRKYANSMFVDGTLLQGEVAMRMNGSLRDDFIEFVKGGTWADSLSGFEECLSILSSCSESAWKRFGYKAPAISGGMNTKSSFETTLGGSFLISDSEPEFMSLKSNAVYNKMIIDECYTAISSSQLFKKDELRSILIAALVPLFFKSPEFQESGKSSAWTSMDENDTGAAEDDLTVNCFTAKKAAPQKPKTERLQEWLLGAAAMFDSSELEAYLADTNSSWIDDYTRALQSVSTIVTVSTVDVASKQSKVVYSNASHSSLLGPDSRLGKNIHELFSTDVSLGGADQIAKAVFDGRRYKRGMVDASGMCRLRALKPVYDRKGRHVYTIGLESCPFEDTTSLESKMLSEEPFQQIEDLLLMLPLLIRTFTSSTEM